MQLFLHIESYSYFLDEVLDRLKYESSRLLTFDKWPASAKVEPRKIAKAGFFYTGQYAEAKCLWCNCVITTWDYGDQVCSNEIEKQFLTEFYFYILLLQSRDKLTNECIF